MSSSASSPSKREISPILKSDSPTNRPRTGQDAIFEEDAEGEGRRLSGRTIMVASPSTAEEEKYRDRDKAPEEEEASSDGLEVLRDAAAAREAHLRKIYPDMMLLELEASTILPIRSPPRRLGAKQLVFAVIESLRAFGFVPRIVGVFGTAKDANTVVMDQFALWYSLNCVEEEERDSWSIDAQPSDGAGNRRKDVEYAIEKTRDARDGRLRGLLRLDLDKGAYRVWAVQQETMSAGERLSGSAAREAEALAVKAWTEIRYDPMKT